MVCSISIQSTPDSWILTNAYDDYSESIEVPKETDRPVYFWTSQELQALAFGLASAINSARLKGASMVTIERSKGDSTLKQDGNRLILLASGQVIYRSPECDKVGYTDPWRFIPGCLLWMAINTDKDTKKGHKLARVEFTKEG